MFNSASGFSSDGTCSNVSSSLLFEVGRLSPGRPLIGDLTLTGFPDIVVGVERSGALGMEIWLSKPCLTSNCQRIEFTRRARLDGIGGLFDLGNDGHLDVVTNEGSYLSTLWSGSFIKVMGLNGLCLEGCSTGSKFPNPAPLGSIARGATVHIEFTDKRGSKHSMVGVQAGTNGLSLPFVLFGLGERAHYVNDVRVVSTFGEERWSWILPDSELYASRNHQGRVYLIAEIDAFWVLFGCISLILGLGLIVLVFSQQEEAEDKKEADEMLPLF
jgi:hypothetical protein